MRLLAWVVPLAACPHPLTPQSCASQFAGPAMQAVPLLPPVQFAKLVEGSGTRTLVPAPCPQTTGPACVVSRILLPQGLPAGTVTPSNPPAGTVKKAIPDGNTTAQQLVAFHAAVAARLMAVESSCVPHKRPHSV